MDAGGRHDRARSELSGQVDGNTPVQNDSATTRRFGLLCTLPMSWQDGHGAGCVGHRTLHVDSQDARVLGARERWQGTAADRS